MGKKLLVALVVLIGAASCFGPLSIHPFYLEKDLITDERLLGAWCDEEDDDGMLYRFERAEGQAYRFTISYKEDGEAIELDFIAHLFRLDGIHYLDLLPQEPYPSDTLWEYQLVPTHSCLRTTFTEDGFRLRLMDLDWLAEALEEGKVRLPYRLYDDRILLTATTKQLRRFLKKHAENPDAYNEDEGTMIRYDEAAARRNAPQPELLSTAMIWEAGAHNAFTDLIRFQDKWFCSFREAQGHVKGDGKIRIITSTDGATWQAAALLEEQGIDLRDPKLSITPDNRLMVVAGGSIYRGEELTGRQSRAAFSQDGHTWTNPQPIGRQGDWLWRVTWHQGRAYGVAYNAPIVGEEAWELTLLASDDGIDFEPITELTVDGKPNETTLRFQPDGTMIALVRREAGSQNGWIGQSAPPYTTWSWFETSHRLGGPNFIILPDGRLIAGTRAYAQERRTILASMATDAFQPILELPSGGDCSYPGLVWHDGLLWMSYYASHHGRTSIYLAKISLPPPE